MEPEDIKELIVKYNNGTASQEQRNLVIEWYESIEGKNPEFAKDEFDALKTEVYNSLQRYQQDKTGLAKQVNLWPRLAGIAAAVAAIVVGIWFFNANRHPEGTEANRDLFANDIAPGKNRATITLADGKVINLSDAKSGVLIDASSLKYNDGTDITDPSLSSSLPARGISPRGGERGSMMLTASTPRGGTYQVVLPDGTKVWLNADSKISFPLRFTGDKRKIVLSGEAYFEVAAVYGPALPSRGISPRRGERVPFVVQTEQQEVTVLGTHFNINAYKDEGIVKTTLLEGSVKVSGISPRGGERVLRPNQQSVVTAAGEITVNEVNTEEAVAWKEGDFIFKDERVENIMLQIARWYNVEVSYTDERIKDVRIGGFVSRSKNISSVLKMMALTKRLNFKIEGRKITVLP